MRFLVFSCLVDSRLHPIPQEMKQLRKDGISKRATIAKQLGVSRTSVIRLPTSQEGVCNIEVATKLPSRDCEGAARCIPARGTVAARSHSRLS
jgi:DNA-binding XRE family transcriptional regulator